MAGSKLSLSYDGIGALLRSAGMETEMIRRATRVKELAESRAPVYSGTGHDPHRGRYKDSFRIDSTLRGGYRNDRAEASVINDSPEAVFVEYGAQAHTTTVRSRPGRDYTIRVPALPARHVLGSALEAAGDG
jgi:hypothetical protein